MVYVLFVKLVGSSDVWRKIAVPGEKTFSDLSETILNVFDLDKVHHMHEFVLTDPKSGLCVKMKNETGWILRPLDVFNEGSEKLKDWITYAWDIVYVYDFENPVIFTIQLEKVLDIPLNRIMYIDGEGFVSLPTGVASS